LFTLRLDDRSAEAERRRINLPTCKHTCCAGNFSTYNYKTLPPRRKREECEEPSLLCPSSLLPPRAIALLYFPTLPSFALSHHSAQQTQLYKWRQLQIVGVQRMSIGRCPTVAMTPAHIRRSQSYIVCNLRRFYSCSVITTVFVLHRAFVRHVRGRHSE